MTSPFAQSDNLNLSVVQAVFVGTSGHDTLVGTESADSMSGNDGNDFLSGGGGNDDISGNAGNDRLDGGEGWDEIQGGDGHDVITDAGGGGFLSGQDGNDTVIGGGGNHSVWGGAGNDSLVGGDGDDTLDGGDSLAGDTGSDVLFGGTGNDVLLTGGGTDSVNGESGNDVLVWHRTDTAAGAYEGGDGTDTFRYESGDIFGTFSGFEVLEGGNNEVRATTAFLSSFATVTGTRFLLTDGGTVNLSGVATDIQVTASSDAAAITTGSGNDTVIGGGGADSLAGGAGDDAYYAGEGDTVTEAEGNGSDTVITALSYTLGANIEILIQTGSDHVTATGNALDNALTSTGGNNWLDGGAGADTLTGGLGDDTYVVDNTADAIVEAADGGSDTVLASASYILSAGVETLTLTGNAAIDGTGNASDNTITGTDGANRLDGGAGVDTLTGGLGDDTYVVDGADLITEAEAAGSDTVITALSYTLGDNFENLVQTGSDNVTATGNGLDNALTSNDGNNWLDGGAGADTLTGGLGDDTYVVDNTAEAIVEAVDGGSDTVLASASYTLSAGIETLTLTGSEAIDGTGNASDNTITGTDAANRLDGGDGVDTLTGGLGDDTYVVDGADLIVEAEAGGTDTVLASVSHTLAADFENLTLTGEAHINATGNGAANTVTGNAGNNWLDGGDGVDTLAGGLGDDTYVVDDAGDKVVELGGSGTDLVLTSVSYSLFARYAENLTLTGDGHINAIGNSLRNTLIGNAGNNAIDAAAGNDWLDGGAGADTLTGGLGDDTFVVDGDDLVIEAEAGGSDTVQASVSHSLVAHVETLVLTGDASINGTGNALANTMTGTLGSNVLDGGAGADTLTGGLGNDTYHVDNAGDNVVEAAAGGADLVIASVTYSLAGRAVESLTLTGSANINATGNGLGNTLTGNGGNNKLDGAVGNDVLDGGTGADSLTGGVGDDTYYVDNTGDKVYENYFEGTDTIIASVSYSLFGRAVETLTLTGGDNLTATGNSLANTLTGNTGHNLLDGGIGADTQAGGAGNDTFVVDNAGDKVIELNGEGTDLVLASVTYSLAGRVVENLTLTGSANINATGNSLGNTLTGNGGVNKLEGAAGNDVLDGGLGADSLTGGVGDDIYYVDNAGDKVYENHLQGTDTIIASVSYSLFGRAVETLTLTGAEALTATGNGLANTLNGNAGSNWLDGGAGADTLTGGAGNDTFVVDNTADKVIEFNGGGTDLVLASVTYSLAGRVIESLTLTGSANINATGNGLGNALTGNSGNNKLDGAAGNDVLDGGLGADSLIGGVGDDTYYVDNAGDKVYENHLEGTDTIIASVSYSLFGRAVEVLTLTGANNLMATGNGLANTLTGNTGNNWLDGGTGADTLVGGRGDDTYYVDNSGDVVVETGASGTDSIFASISYSLAGRTVEALTLTGSAKINATGNGLANTLTGNDGNNRLDGGAGNDTATGGLGADVFVFLSGKDTVTDFTAAQNDSIDVHAITGGMAHAGMVAQAGADVVITLGGGNVVTVLNATQADVLAHMVW